MGIQFGYWAPLEKNGLLATKIPSRTSSSFEANIRYASIGEKVGYDYVLLPTRFISSSIAMDVTGGYGYKRGPIERLYRDARAGMCYLLPII